MQDNPFTREGAEFDKSYRIAYLIAGFIQENLSPAEREELDDWVGDSNDNLILFEELTDEQNLQQSLRWFRELDMERARKRVQKKIGIEEERPLWKRILPYAVAACFLVVVGLGIRFYFSNKDGGDGLVQNGSAEVMGASSKAVLTLGDGRKIVLDSAASGLVALEGSSNIIIRDSLLRYEPLASAGGVAAMNEISAPKGGQYHFRLPDGSMVWLNAESSLRFPSFFDNERRLVELHGEAYFEVVADTKRSFLVNINGAQVHVLGTHFNINGYADEADTRVTLLEGSVQIGKGDKKILLQPGNQAIVSNKGEQIELQAEADMDAGGGRG